jgi:spore coat protein U-like protein
MRTLGRGWWLPAVVGALISASAWPAGGQSRGPHKACSFDGESMMAFGNYDPLSNNALDLQGRIAYRCYVANKVDQAARARGLASPAARDSGKLIVQISISPGNGGSFNRYMTGTGDRLHYNVYLDPQRQRVWGDGTGGTQFYTEHAQPNNHVVVVPVYGRIMGAQDIQAGTYADRLVVTLDF